MRAQVECRGSRGITQHCIEALANYLQECRATGLALLLSSPEDQHHCRSHAILLLVDGLPEALVLDGFASGYGGEGPAGLSTAICLLDSRNWDINEIEITEKLFERICAREATQNDLDQLLKLRRKPISDVFLYVHETRIDRGVMIQAWDSMPINIPLPLIDPRIFDVAINFWNDPDALLSKAYRRLEDAIRQRSGLNGANDHGAKLFARAFGNEKSPLTWLSNGEETACHAQLFTAAFLGFRNNRAHREPDYESARALTMELLLLNMLFTLEAQLVSRENSTMGQSEEMILDRK